MTVLRVSTDREFSLPADTVTSSIVVYGGKGMGKSNLASVLCEEVAAASGSRFSLIDPMGVLWGLRYAADGKGPGIELLILGGVHGDIPIEPTGGEVVADLVADENVSVLVDISRHPDGLMWSKSERVRFVAAYCRRLYMRQGERRRPLLQVIDEAARFCPQMIRQGDVDAAACVGAVADLVEEGRNVGVGVALFTQRSARLSKDVAELADMMVAFRTVGPNSMKAVLDWLGEYVEKERHKEIALALRKLARGEALVVSPGWLEHEGIVQMRARHTFDSSATPKAGQAQARVSGPGAKPDLTRYVERMRETVARAAVNDPMALRAGVRELEAALLRLPDPSKAETKTVSVPVLGAKGEKILERVDSGIRALVASVSTMPAAAELLRKEFANLRAALPRDPDALSVPIRFGPLVTVTDFRSEGGPVRATVDGVSAPADLKKRIVSRLSYFHPVPLTREQLAFVCDISRTTKSYIAAMAELAAEGQVAHEGGRTRRAILQNPGAWTPVREPRTRAQIILEFARKADRLEVQALEHVVRQHPNGVRREDLAGALKISRTTKSFIRAVAALTRCRFLVARGGKIGLGELLAEGRQ